MRKQPKDLPETTRPAGVPDSWVEHVKLMFDLQTLALQADLTRVWTFLYAREATFDELPASGHLDGAPRDLASQLREGKAGCAREDQRRPVAVCSPTS